MNLLGILGLGFLLGLRHAADPDHVVAVGAITARTGRVGSAAWIVAFGAWLLWQVGWRDGMFLAVPHWTPH